MNKSCFFVFAEAACLISLAVALAPAQTVGNITGTILDPSGKPVSGATISAVRTGDIFVAGSPAFNFSRPSASTMGNAKSDSAGAYQLQTLPTGAYRLCVSAPGWLDPCVWTNFRSASLTPLNVAGGQTLTAPLRLQNAVNLQIRINDPKGLLTASHPERGAFISVKTDSGTFERAHVVATDVSGQLLTVPVPPGRDFKLAISGLHVVLADAAGAAIPASGGSATVTSAGGTPIVYTVVSTLP
jgi:hypothetical protein